MSKNAFAKFCSILTEGVMVGFLITTGALSITALLDCWQSSLIYEFLCFPIATIIVIIFLHCGDGEIGNKKVYDWIIHQQHQRHQRILQRQLLEKEWAGVPNKAISRARPPGEPEPSTLSLSVAEPPEEVRPRLTIGAGEPTIEEAVVELI